jgi:hypothetical protein
MKKTVISVLLAVLLPVAAHAQSDGARGGLIIGGAGAVTAGVILMVTAFDYTEATCGLSDYTIRYQVPNNSGYGTHDERTCIATYRNSASIYTPSNGGIPGTATFARPNYMWSGVALASGGAIALYLGIRSPRVAKTLPSIVVTPTVTKVSKTFRF